MQSGANYLRRSNLSRMNTVGECVGEWSTIVDTIGVHQGSPKRRDDDDDVTLVAEAER